jgi:hypothetical protein
MSETPTIEVRATTYEIQRVLHTAICGYAADRIDVLPVEASCGEWNTGGTGGVDFLDAQATVMRAVRIFDLIGNLGEPHDPPNFEELNLTIPRILDAVRACVAWWLSWCEDRLREGFPPDPDRPNRAAEDEEYWTSETAAVRRVLELIDGEPV